MHLIATLFAVTIQLGIILGGNVSGSIISPSPALKKNPALKLGLAEILNGDNENVTNVANRVWQPGSSRLEVPLPTNRPQWESFYFVVYTSKKPPSSRGYPMLPWNRTALLESGFIHNASTIFICHGYFGSYRNGPGKELVYKYLESARSLNKTLNIILVDWSEHSKDLTYVPAAQRVDWVGEATAEQLKTLFRYGNISTNHIHLIGYSLGAHAMGFAGREIYKELHQKVARITALDPAGPCFESLQLCPYRTSLLPPINKSDALFVDAIHTHSCLYGMQKAVGHVDFYPNGGLYQPECSSYLPNSCSHRRSVKLFEDSITKDIYATKCTSWESFLIRDCDPREPPVLLGERGSTNTTGKYFLKTTDTIIEKCSWFSLNKNDV